MHVWAATLEICVRMIDIRKLITAVSSKHLALPSGAWPGCCSLDVAKHLLVCCWYRQEIISGKGTPTAEELRGYLATGDSTTALTGHKGVPYFWLNALHNQVNLGATTFDCRMSKRLEMIFTTAGSLSLSLSVFPAQLCPLTFAHTSGHQFAGYIS